MKKQKKSPTLHIRLGK